MVPEILKGGGQPAENGSLVFGRQCLIFALKFQQLLSVWKFLPHFQGK